VRYDSIPVLHEQIPSHRMNGQLAEHPLAELIRETSTAELSGTLRLEHQRVKVALYFDRGAFVYASSNLRSHRLAEALKRIPNPAEAQLAGVDPNTPDSDLAAALSRGGAATAETLERARISQVIEVLRTALLWEDGTWEFDAHARLAEEIRVSLDLTQLLMECARRQSAEFLMARLTSASGVFSSAAAAIHSAQLLPVEAFVLSRVEGEITLSELAALSAVAEAEAHRAIYALVLGGLLKRAGWPEALPRDSAKGTVKSRRPGPKAKAAIEDSKIATNAPDDGKEDLDGLFDRLTRARDHYDVLDLGRNADGTEVKLAYHALARSYHPDRYHQSDLALRSRVDSAFARIAQAYETLSDPSSRAAYDAKLAAKPAGAKTPAPAATNVPVADEEADEKLSKTDRAEAAFKKGMTALQQKQSQAAIIYLAEAAHFAPRDARFRANYGRALSAEKKNRRLAEAELKTAVALAPDNAAYRIMLAELYRDLGLRRRAQGELERALIAEPKNKEARALLASLQRPG